MSKTAVTKVAIESEEILEESDEEPINVREDVTLTVDDLLKSSLR